MKLTNNELKKIIKEEFDKTMMMKKLAMFITQVGSSGSTGRMSLVPSVVDMYESGNIDEAQLKVFVTGIKRAADKSFNIKFHGKGLRDDLKVTLRLSKLIDEWQQLDNLDDEGMTMIMAKVFGLLPRYSPIQ